jgi:hypothetical protein
MFNILKNDPGEIGRMLAEQQQQRQQRMSEPIKDPAQEQYLNSLREEAAKLQQQADEAQAKQAEISAKLQEAVARIGGGQ